MNGVVYKWRIKDCIYGYLTDRVGGDPFISSTKENDEQISKAVNSFDEEQYKSHYEALCRLLKQKGYNVQMLDYKYYYGVDDTSCGLLKYAGEAYKGETGKDGISVVDVMALGDFNGFSVLRFTFSNGTHKDVPIRTPKDGVSPENGVDGADGNTLALIMELDHEKAEFQAEIESALTLVRQEMRELWNTSRDALTSFQIDLSALTHNSGYIQTVMDELAGLERKIYGYIDISALTKTEFEQVFAPYSGYVETLGTYVNSALQTVVLFENRIDMAEAQLHTAMSYYDNIAGVLNGYDEKYNAVKGRYDQIVAQLTANGTISFTDIFQTARSVGMILASDSSITDSDSLYYDYGDTLVAGIIAKINDNNSGTEMQIRADKIYLLGETVASGLSALDIWVGGGNTHFDSDGSGYIANHYIEWDKWGNVTIQGQLSVDEIIDTLGNSMIQFGTNGGSKAQTMFSPDGSGWLSGGAIYWDENGHLTISKDVTIEGQLSISQMVDGIRKETVCFGDTESTAVTIFRPDGSGQLAGGAISWDVDGRLVIANDLYVTGSIYQGFLNYANGADVNFGNFTSNFYADGDFNLANGALIYDSDTSTLTIKGNVVISGADQETADSLVSTVIAALNTRDIAIGGGTSYIGSDGSGWLANHAIEWDDEGNMSLNGDICLSTSYKTNDVSQKNIIYLVPDATPGGAIPYGLKCTPASRGKFVIVHNPSPYGGKTYKIECYEFTCDDSLDPPYEEDPVNIYSCMLRPQESGMFVCLQTKEGKYRWELANRFGQYDFRDETSIGRYPLIRAMGTVSNDLKIRSLLWNGEIDKISVEILNNGNVRVDFGVYGAIINPYTRDEDYPAHYLPIVTPYNNTGSNVSVCEIDPDSFEVHCANTNQRAFIFILLDKDYWSLPTDGYAGGYTS